MPPNPFITKDAFSQQAQKSISDATMKVERFQVAQARAARETVAFADATGRGRITLENFGRTFDNATRKVLVWQFAILAVYGVMRKVGETLDIWKEFEVTLARISITTGALGDKLRQYFKDVADVAIEFGTDIDATLVGMDLALRATASLGDGAKRTATAVTLLKDASALANITGMQYGQAIDILVGSLRQSGLQLDNGIDLLDKWVAVAKNAAVSVNDLSQGFAIMADAGRAAGLTVDQINGLIAALSETVTLGPTEIGNAIRALMSTLYNPGSISLLQKYGVAVRDTEGEVRNFWEVMQELSSMRMADVLDESSWLEIAKAAGAGQRRYAQFLALLNNFSTAMRVAGVSADAQGQAMDANDKIVNTLTNTWDKFTAAQRKFLFVMGDQTGAIEDLTNALQGLTNFFDNLSNASDSVYKLGRAIMFLVGTMTSLKIASLAIGWLGLGPMVGSAVGRFAGISASRVAGSGAAMKALQAGGITTSEGAMAAGIGTMGAGRATSLGLYSLMGLLGLGNRVRPSEISGINWKGGAWRTPTGQFARVPSVGGQPYTPTTWGRVGGALSRGTGFGLGSAVAGLGVGAAAYGMTGEWQSAAGAGIGSAIGLALGGPIGLAAGGAIGGFAGHAIADALVSEEDRIRGLFADIAEQFSINLSEAEDKYFGKATASTLAEAQKLASLAAPSSPLETLKSNQSWFSRLGASLGFETGALPFLANGNEINRSWKGGTGAIYELNKAVQDGLIDQERYQTIVKKTAEIGQFAWAELTEDEKALLTTMRAQTYATGEYKVALEQVSEVLGETIVRNRELANVTNRYSESQDRIRQIMGEVGTAVDGINLKEWEQSHIQALLEKQLTLTSDEFQSWYDVLLGASYGYASHLESVERLSKALQDYGITIEAIKDDKWLLLQRWDPDLSTKIVESARTLTDLINDVDTFKIGFKDILTLAGVEGTIDDIDKVKDALSKLYEQTGEEKYNKAVTSIEQYLLNLMNVATGGKLYSTQLQTGATFQRETQVRLSTSDTIAEYQKQLGQLGEHLPTFTKLAESLGKYDTSVLTLVDPLTGQTLRLEENTLALEMLQQAVQDNTKTISSMNAEYNLPSGYARPSRYWYYRTTGSTEFGPQQQGLWAMWEDFIKERGRASGGDINQTGAYYLHKNETVLNGSMLDNTNNILMGNHQVLVNSQNYLSQISMGISALRYEVAALRGRLSKTSINPQKSSFSSVTNSGMSGDIPTFGARGLLN